MQKLLVIVGPTASGKSALAVRLARTFGGEVISADSRQVYRGLDIGTGKITKREMKGIRHHLLDVASPLGRRPATGEAKKYFSANDFMHKGRAVIEDVSRRGKLPIVAGGTGFYIDALVGRIVLPNVPPNEKLRKILEKKTAKQLLAMLRKKDPRRARTIEPDNKRRIIRALEIARALGKNPLQYSKNPYNTSWIGVAPSDNQLRKNITVRLFVRIRHGMIREAIQLHKKGLSYKRMEELGLEYRSLARFLRKKPRRKVGVPTEASGKITRAELEKELRSDIWRYARKQLGYWKRNKEIQWFSPKDAARIEKRVRAWLKQ